jgi:hypothetical protein
MTATMVPELVARTEAGEVLPSLLRGRIGVAPIAQAAIVYAHQQLCIAARDALTVTSVTRIDAERALVTLATPHGTFVVTVLSETGPAVQLTCRGPEGVRARAYRGTQITSTAS